MFLELLRTNQQSAGYILWPRQTPAYREVCKVRGPAPLGHVSSKKRSRVSHLEGPVYEIKVTVIMQNLCRSQLMYHPSAN